MKIKRLIALLSLTVGFALVPMSNYVLAGDDDKIDICHFPGNKAEGHVISVGGAALDVHLTMHGDTTQFKMIDDKHCVPACKIKKCGKGEEFDEKLCKCVPSKCTPTKCQPGEVWSDKHCACVPEAKK